MNINLVQRSVLALGSAVYSIVKPSRGDMIATLAETTVPLSLLKHLHCRMACDSSGIQLLREKPRINNKTMNRGVLHELPDGTLGREYSRFLDQLNTSPDARPPVQFLNDPDLVYIMQRYRESHDFIHVLLQMRTNMLGEVTVKYFEAIQFGLPMCVAAALFGGIRLGPIHRQQLLDYNLPWAVEQACKARFMLAFDWENHLEEQITDLQCLCSIDPLKYQLPHTPRSIV